MPLRWRQTRRWWSTTRAIAKPGGFLAADSEEVMRRMFETNVFGVLDTDLTRGFDVPKTSPEQIVQRALDGLEAGAEELLTDELTQRLKQAMTAQRPGYLQAQQA